MSLNENLHFGACKDTFLKAKELRLCMTDAEKMLWQKIRNKKLGYKFRRQHPLNKFIADFYCHEIKLVIEVDGEIHEKPERQDYDIGRTKELENLGIKVIRYKNEDIVKNIDVVITDILEIIRHL